MFYKKENGELIVNEKTIAHLSSLLDKHGTDFWWTLPVKDLLPSSLNLEEKDVEQGKVR